MIQFTMSKWSAEWSIGEYAIRWDKRHRCYDVSKGNAHYYCTYSFKDAVRKVLELQGWGDFQFIVSSASIPDWDHDSPLKLVSNR